MGTDRQRFLDDCTTVKTLLTGETGIDSDNLMTGTFSLDSKDTQKLSPSSITNRLGKMMVFYHPIDIEVFHSNHAMGINILLCHFEVEIMTLTANLEMGLGCTLCCFT